MRTQRRASMAFPVFVAATLAVAMLSPRPAYSQPCEPHWADGFSPPGLNGAVNALTTFDDGGGPALYVGGAFTTAGGVAANRIAKWSGGGWSPLGSGVNDRVYALAVFDDGSGPALYAGGIFTTAGGVVANHIAKWNGST